MLKLARKLKQTGPNARWRAWFGIWFVRLEAVFFQIYCAAQSEVDRYWAKLTEGGDKDAQQGGWLKTKYG